MEYHKPDAAALEKTVQSLKSEIAVIKKHEQQLEDCRRKAERAAEYKSQFLANMSHEIRTPLSLILGFTEELIGSTQLDAANMSLVNIIRRNSEALERLIADILDLSRIESGNFEYAIHPIQTADFLKNLSIEASAKCQEKGLPCEIIPSNSLPPSFLSDEVRLKQILMNLICNSAKYTSRGSVRVNIGFDNSSQNLLFDIIDTGEGIPLEQQQRIFDVFKQGSNRSKPGTGLGLPLSRKLARGLGGDVTLIHSRPKEGAWFQVKIPKSQVATTPTPPSHWGTPTEPPDLSTWKILIIDDLEDNIKLLESILKPTHAVVESTTSAAESIKKLARTRYDLILVDLHMPEMDGFETLRRARESGCDSHIWAVSASAMQKDLMETQAAGFGAHVTKPIRRHEFYQKLSRLSAEQKNFH